MATERGRPRGAEILKEPFGETTTRHRKSLVAVSTIAIFVSLTGWFPSEISAIGLRIGIAEKSIVLWGLIISVLYFLVSFLIHLWPESVYRDARIYSYYQMDDEQIGFPWQLALMSYAARNAIYLVLPLLISAIALICLVWVALSPSTSATLSEVVLWTARAFSILLMIFALGILIGFTIEVVPSLLGMFRASRAPKKPRNDGISSAP